MTDFHTQTAQQHAQKLITKTISESEYEQKTMCIMMEAKWGDRVPLITPMVVSVIPGGEGSDDLRKMCNGIVRYHSKEVRWSKDGNPALDVRWAGETPRPESASTMFVFDVGADVGALLRYLKERGGVDTIVVR